MRELFIIVLFFFCVVSVDALTDEEMYNQMSDFITRHSNIPTDKKLVENILASTKWQELVAQFGPLKKRTVKVETKKKNHK